MSLIIQGKNIEVTDWLRQYVEKKVGRLDRYLPDIQETRVELSAHRTKSAQDRYVAQITLRANRAILRAEERSHDIFAAIDTVVDKIYRQIDRYKGRRWRKRGYAEAEPVPLEEEAAEEEEGPRIVRVKRFAVTPMDPEEAIEQMELLGHDFFIFYNPEDEAINVVYRRADGNYGLIQPELV
ncbi:MAG TPA: ribosome-associated translation inhibitor RaiA [Caldilineae bacterium]|nr:ribosome-associated translation inhibitor RaiA [Caldilineae bacterium]